MKRIFAWLLCLAMLVSQMAVAAMAAEQSVDGGVAVADGGELIYAPASDSTDHSALASDAEDATQVALPEESEPPVVYEIYEAVFNKEQVMIYSVAGEDAESVFFQDAMGVSVEIAPTVSPLWYALTDVVSSEISYNYVRAEDVTLVGEKRPAQMDYYLDEATGVAVHLPALDVSGELRIAPVAAERAPLREIPGRVMGERTLWLPIRLVRPTAVAPPLQKLRKSASPCRSFPSWAKTAVTMWSVWMRRGM